MIKRVEIIVSAPGARETEAQLDAIAAKVKALNGMKTEIKVTVDDSGAIAKLAALKGAQDAAAGATEKASRSTRDEGASLLFASRMMASFNEATRAGLAATASLTAAQDKMRDALDAVGVAEQFAATEAGKLVDVYSQLAVTTFTESLAQNEAADAAQKAARAYLVLGAAEQFVNGEQEKLAASAAALKVALGPDGGAFGSAMKIAGLSKMPGADQGGGGFGGFIGGLMASMGMGPGKGNGIFGWGAVPLFGGLGSIGAFHLLADSVLEVGATLIPATVAMVSFGVAGTDAANNIYRHFTNLHTVMDATGKSIYPMTGAMEALHRAVTPMVYSMLGDALTLMNSKSGVFSQIATGAGGVLANLFARGTVALESGGAGFLRNGVQDLQQWGSALGNIFGTIGNIMKTLPGYANLLLSGFDGLTHGVETLTGTGLVQWLLGAGLGMHGFLLYTGLAATGLMRLAPLASRIVTGLAGSGPLVSTALRDLGTEASSIQTDASKVSTFDRFKAAMQDMGNNLPVVGMRIKALGVAEEDAATKTTLLARAGNTLTRVPTGVWAIAAAAGMYVYGNAILHVGGLTARTGQWIGALNTQIANSPLMSLGHVLSGGISQTEARLGALMNTRAGNTVQWSGLGGFFQHGAGSGSMFGNIVQGTQALAQAIGLVHTPVQQLQSELQQLQQESHQFTGFMNSVGPSVGGVRNALGLMNATGITSAQVLKATEQAAKGNIEPLLVLRQELTGTYKAYQAMGQRGGQLGNDLQMLDAQATDQYAAVQKLNQGWDTFTANMTATQGNFDNFALGMKTLDSTASTFTNHLGNSTLSIANLGKHIDGLSQKDLALNQAFTQNVSNANSVADSWRQAGLAGNYFQSGMRGMIAQMLPFAKGSQEATAQLVGLAQEAGYQGPVSFKALVKWLGDTHHSLQMVKDASNQATIQAALLTSSMRAQGNMIANQLVGDINKGILGYNKVAAAATNYGRIVAQFGSQSQQAIIAQGKLTSAIIQTGIASHSTAGQIEAMIMKVLGIPKKVAIQIVEEGLGTYSIRGIGGSMVPHGTHLTPSGGAAGGMVHGGVPGRDSVLAMLMPGEVVVPTHMVNRGAVDHLRGALPGFASGGRVGANPLLTGNLGVLNGSAAVNFNAAFIGAFTAAMEAQMNASMRSSMAATAAAYGGFVRGGDVYYITAPPGANDPVAWGRQLHQTLSRYKVLNGNISLGLG